MKIAIFGSNRTRGKIGDGIDNQCDMRDFCLKLGAHLAGLPHKVLVESDLPSTADRMITDGLLNARQIPKARVMVYHRSQVRTALPYAADARRYSDVFLYKPVSDIRVSPTHLRMLRDADLAIIIGGGTNSYAAGLAASFMGIRMIPVALFGGAGRLLWQQLSDQFDSPIVKLPLRHTWDNLAGDPIRVLDVVERELASLPRLMIVHGRSSDRLIVEEILRTLGIVQPIILQERFKPGQTIPEKFEREALQADGAVVLFTPDDEAAPLLTAAGEPVSAPELRRRARARQNVSLEYGWFWGRLGRERVLLLMKGELELPSDLAGLLYESYTRDPQECQSAIADFIDSIRSS